MELSQVLQRALLRLIGTFCLEEIKFREQVHVSAEFVFHVDEVYKYQFTTEEVVRRDEASVYKKASFHKETQTSVDQEQEPTNERQKSKPAEIIELPVVKIEVEPDIAEDVEAESDSMVQVMPSSPLQAPSKRGRKPKKKESSSCPLCPLSFQEKDAVEQHLKTFHDIGNHYTCSVCGTECVSTVELMDHINKKHENTKRKKAAVEKRVTRSRKSAPKKATRGVARPKSGSKKNKTTVRKKSQPKDEDLDDEFEDDIEEKTKSRDKKVIADESFVPENEASTQVKCAACGKEYKSKRALRRHFATIHDMTEYQCEVCGKNFTGKESLYHHKRGLHMDLKPYKCSEPGCDATFNFNHSLRLHKLKHSGSRPHQCSDCGKTYLTAYHLKVHSQATHSQQKQFSCSHCGKMFSYSTSLKMHEATHQKQLRVHCDQCDKTFVNAQALKYHVMSKHSEAGHFPCNECKKVYKTEFLLRAHVRRHTTDGHRFMCDLCGRQFMYRSALEMHKAIHKDEKAYECNICNKTFKTYPTLYSHRYVHKEESPYKCEVCKKAFKTKERCKAHEKRHSGLKPFECKICHHCFPDNGGLSKHMKTVHCTVKKFICDICGKATSRADNLRVHMKVHFKGEGEVQKQLPKAVKEVKSDMPTVVPLTIHGALHKKDRDNDSLQENSMDSLSSATAGGAPNTQNDFGNMMVFNQSIPNLPTLDPCQLSSNSEDQSLPLNLQNHSNTVPAGYQLAKLSASNSVGDNDTQEVAHSSEHQENSTVQSVVQLPNSVSMPSLQASPFVYAPWQGFVYTAGIQPPQGGANGFFQ